MPKLDLRDLDRYLERYHPDCFPDFEEADNPLALSTRIAVSSDAFKEYQERLQEAPKKDIRQEVLDTRDRIIECVRGFKTVIPGTAIDNSTRARPEDFFTGEYLDNGDTRLIVSFLDFSSFVEFEGALFYRALEAGVSTYNRESGILVKSMFPIEIMGRTWQELKKLKKFPCISVSLDFSPESSDEPKKVSFFNSVVKIDKQIDFVKAKRILDSTESKPRQQLTKRERHIRVLNDIASSHTRFNPATDRRDFGQIPELKQLALGYLGSAMAENKTPAIWLSTFHHRMLRHMPLICPETLTVQRGFKNVNDEVVNACRDYLEWIEQTKQSKLAFALDATPTYSPTDFRTSFRADNAFRESLGFLNGYPVQAFLEANAKEEMATGEYGVAPEISELRRVISCRAADLNSAFMSFVQQDFRMLALRKL